VALASQAKKAAENIRLRVSCSVWIAEGKRGRKILVNPLTAYAKSRCLPKGIWRSCRRAFTVTSLRFPTACGMSERLRLDLVLNDFVAGAVVSKKITVFSDGTPWRPLINGKDMARAIDWAVQRKREAGGDFLALNAGSDQWNYQIRDLAFAVAEFIPGVGVEINRNAQPDKRTYRVDFGLFKGLAPGYQPEVSLKDTINELVAGLESIHFRDDNYRGSNFIRLKMLNMLHQKGFITETLEWKPRKLQKTSG
jgi:nucleoside-diphosphate-sugar epimerase